MQLIGNSSQSLSTDNTSALLSSLEQNRPQFQIAVQNVIQNCPYFNDSLSATIRPANIHFITRTHLEYLKQSSDPANQFLATQLLQSAPNQAAVFC